MMVKTLSSNTKNKIRVGLVGAGQWARFGHIPALRALPGYELVAVATTRQETAQRAAEEFGIPRAYDNAQQLIERSDIDLVIVNNRAPEHFLVAQKAIAAQKHVYCEWPLTTNTVDSQTLLHAANKAGVRHAVGLQRRMAASNRYLRELLESGYVGEIRSVNLHVTEPTFYQQRARVLAFTAPAENFSSVMSIYGGHYLDMLFWAVGNPQYVQAFVSSQFDNVTLQDTGEVIASSAPDQLVVGGTYSNGAVLSVHVEGGKRNGYGVRLDITGTEGDLRLTYNEAFSNSQDGKLQGAQGNRQPLCELPIPEGLQWTPRTELGGSVHELANLYAAFAKDLAEGTHHAPTFTDAVSLHQWLDLFEHSSGVGQRLAWNSSEVPL